MLHTRSSEAYSYGLERTLCLKKRLEDLTGKSMSDAALLNAIEESNLTRKAIRALLSLRRQKPRVSGAESLALIGASFFASRDGYAPLAEQAAKVIGDRAVLAGKRLLISGAALNHRALHRALEKHAAVVVAEDDWWGSRSVGGDIADDLHDPLKAVFEKYYLDTPSPRLYPFELSDAWFQQASADGIDGVVFYLPPEDCVAGWDYPRRRHYLDERRIPHFVVREDAKSISEECHQRIEAFISSIGR
jgi:benzoyl-CoA reductase/2-hydroxyglutaryl-CoA dehydratase subunit BcrC/BadD/HgdB